MVFGYDYYERGKSMKSINEATYVDKAEKVIRRLMVTRDKRTGRPVKIVTTSKIRNLLAMTADIYNQLLREKGDKIPESCMKRIEYLRIRFIYEAGRDTDHSVKAFVEVSGILDALKEIGNSREKYLLFSRYMEALVAFRKYLGGKD